MLKKFTVGALLGLSLGFSASLTDLLNAVQNQITDYEQQGLAIENPYTYTVLKNYYKFGKLFAAYGLVGPATDLLELANCAIAPLNCKSDRFFLQNVPLNYYYEYKKKIPIVLADFETNYNAYAEWWIGQNLKDEESFKEYKNLDGILRSNFIKSFEAFLSAVQKPVPFFITLDLRPNDLFLLNTLKSAYYNGLVKNLVFCGPKGDFIYLVQKGLLPETTVYKAPPSNRCGRAALIWVY
jgi:hypothetical protein